MKHDDTIVAVATAAGVGGIAVVRLSGDTALTLALRHLDVAALAPRHATYCHFDNLDDVVTTYFPRGYSGEPTVEIACHGSRYLQQALVDCLVADGARLAEPGEFTLRAFRHGRLNLAQAEAVADLVEAVTPVQHRLATSQLRGGYAAQLKDLRRQLLDLTSLLELELDFSQEEVEFADRTRLRELLTQLNADITRLTSSFALGNALKRGIPVAIVGAPNVGKSTLLNALLQDDRAIVSEVPGTTRDTIEECLTLDGITFRLVDTAGLRDTADRVERLGIERSRRAQEEAMIVVEVLSPENPENPETPEYPEHPEFPGQTHLTVLNKCDLLSGEVQRGDGEILQLSAKTSEGLDTLKQALVAAAGGARQEEVLLTNSRHREALQHVQEALGQVAAGLEGGVPADLLAVDLRDALYHLGTITGEVANDEVLGNIFARFCIGK